MPVRELFHVMHVVDDFDAADGFFTSLFSPEVTMPKSWSDFDKRWASIGLIGPNFALEIMEPSKHEADQGSPIPKFFRRFGEHLHSIALYVDADDLGGVIESLRANGVRVVRPDGSPFGDGELGDLPRTVFTHGRDTCGQLELQVFPGLHDPRFTDGWSGDYWRVEHPLGIERMSHVTVVVRDVDRARDLYVHALGARVVHEASDDTASRAFVLVGTDTIVEFVQTHDADSRWGRELASNGELPSAVTFLVRDLDVARRHVEKVGARVIDAGSVPERQAGSVPERQAGSVPERQAGSVPERQAGSDSFTIDPADAFGAVISFTTRAIPDDPRKGAE